MGKNISLFKIANRTLRVTKPIIKPEFVFLILLLVVFFAVYPPNLNFGDHASYGLIYQKNLINYQKARGNFDGNFDDYVRGRYEIFHLDKLTDESALDSYNLDTTRQINWITEPSYYSVYIFPRLSRIIIYYLFLGKISVEMCLVFFGVLIFILTYIYAYKLGNLLIGRNFGFALAVISTSSVYFNQLIRSMIAPFIAVYPLLFFSTTYYLILIHEVKKKHFWLSFFGLVFFLSLCFLNGYPNTNVIIPVFLTMLFMILLFQVKIIKNPRFKLLRWQRYGLVILGTAFLTFSISAIWSRILGHDIFYGIYYIFSTRIWGQILRGIMPPKTYIFSWWQIPYILKNLFRVLFFSSDVHIGPHEPGFLLDISFFNFIEALFFLTGTFLVIKKLFSKNLLSPIISNFFFFLLLFFFVYRLRENSANYLIVSRYTFDFYFLTIFFVAFGLDWLVNLSFFNKKRRDLPVLVFILIISIGLNAHIFNKKFIWKFEENLKQTSGVYQLRQLFKNEISQGNNLFVYDFNRSNCYEYHIDLISLLENKTDYETYQNFLKKNSINSLASFKSFLNSGRYDNVYIVLPVGLSQMGESVMFETLYNFHGHNQKFASYFSPYKTFQVIKNRRGIPTFWIYKFDKDYQYYSLELDKNKTVYEFNFDGKGKIDFIDFPGLVKEVEIFFNNQASLKLNFDRFAYDWFHFSFDEKSVIDIYNNFNFGEAANNIKINDLILFASDLAPDGRRIDFLEPQKALSEVVFEYLPDYPIIKAFFNVPFIFYNDQFFNNEFSVLFRENEESTWKIVNRKKSNGNLRYLDYNYYYPFEAESVFYPNAHFNHFGVLDLNSKSLYLQYKINSILPRSVRPYSSFSLPEGTNNFVKLEVDTSQHRKYKDFSTEKLTFKIKFKDFQKGDYDNFAYIGLANK